MNYKHLLKFYFYADSLNGALDDVCVRFAKASADCTKGCEYYAEKISDLIEAKCELNGLWLFLDGVLGTMTEGDRTALKNYADSRGKLCGETIGDNEAKAEHRALMKFSRRVSGKTVRYEKQVNVLREYYCLVVVGALKPQKSG